MYRFTRRLSSSPSIPLHSVRVMSIFESGRAVARRNLEHDLDPCCFVSRTPIAGRNRALPPKRSRLPIPNRTTELVLAASGDARPPYFSNPPVRKFSELPKVVNINLVSTKWITNTLLDRVDPSSSSFGFHLSYFVVLSSDSGNRSILRWTLLGRLRMTRMT